MKLSIEIHFLLNYFEFKQLVQTFYFFYHKMLIIGLVTSQYARILEIINIDEISTIKLSKFNYSVKEYVFGEKKFLRYKIKDLVENTM